MKSILENILPGKVFIGRNPYCQPAYLKDFDYIVSNENPKRINNNELLFHTLKDFKNWVESLNKVMIKLQDEYSKLSELKEISEYINEEFQCVYLPNISLEFDINKLNSVLLSCNFLYENIRERNTIRKKFLLFLRNNKLLNLIEEMNLENIKKNVIEYKLNYPTYYKKLKNIYHLKFDKIDDSHSILRLSQRSEVPYIATKQFLIDVILEEKEKILKDEKEKILKDEKKKEGIREEKKESNMIADMRKKRLEFFK